ncbi:MAG: glycosyltransferase [Actinobacteria bacterium]|nr:glycosyltransferase [Actinomycetota bacterium]
MNSDKTVVLIPAYEPDVLLSTFVQDIKAKTNYEIVVVDDGSSQNASTHFENVKRYATVLRLETNRGKGTAIKTGLGYIGENFSEGAVVVTADADGQHSVDDLIRVCKAARVTKDSLVIGSRTFTGDTPLRSRFGNTVTRYVFMFASGLKLNDTQTGLRAFNANMIPALLGVKGERYEYEMNMLLGCSKNDVSIREVPIEAIYIEDNSSSHFDTLKDSFIIYRDIIKFASSSLVSFLIDFGMYSSMIWLTSGFESSLSILISNVTARTISASFNYYVNKKYVFKSEESIWKTAGGYVLLAASILVLNTLLLTLLASYVISNKFAGKIVVELIMFTVSWSVQRFFVFSPTSRRKHAHYE